MEIFGYSERGVMNALFYEMTFNEKAESEMKAFLKLAWTLDDLEGSSGVKDWESFENFKLYMEFSLSDFGDPDLVIIANKRTEEGKKTERVVIFVEAKVSECSNYSIMDAFKKYTENINKKEFIKGETSNLFFQLKLKQRLFETRGYIPDCEYEYVRKEKEEGTPFDKIQMTRNKGKEVYRSIGNNPVVRKFVDEIKNCQSALYIALVPELKEELKEVSDSVRMELGDIYLISWQDIYKSEQLKKYVEKTISFNQGIDPTLKSKDKVGKSQILNNPIQRRKRRV